MKACKDCRYCDKGSILTFPPSLWKCKRPETEQMYEVKSNFFLTGKKSFKKVNMYCSDLRTSKDQCGPAGQYFEPKRFRVL